MIEAFVQGFLPKGYHTENAATPIDEKLPGRDGYRLALKSMIYLAAATAHIGSFMYAEDLAGQAGSSRNTNGAAVAVSGQTHIITAVAPKDPGGNAAAANDIIAYQLTDGTWEFNTIASIAGSNITLNTNIAGVDAGAGATAIAAGAKVLIFGVVGDNKSLRVRLTASVTTTYTDLAVIHPYVGEPFYLSIDNPTNAGFLYSLTMAYINK